MEGMIHTGLQKKKKFKACAADIREVNLGIFYPCLIFYQILKQYVSLTAVQQIFRYLNHN